MEYPTLSERYDKALREAVAYILPRFEVAGLVAAGSIIRGTPNDTSDFDLYVINAQPQRQLIHRIFNGVPVQFFVNPVHQVRRFFADERADGGPSTAHMLATGFIMLDRDGVVAELRQEAQAILQSSATVSPQALMMARYHALDHYQNALDMAASDPTTSSMIAHRAVYDMLHYLYLTQQKFLPRDKDLLARLDADFPQVAALARTFFSTADPQVRIDTAGQIADLTIQTRVFFEMETGLQDV